MKTLYAEYIAYMAPKWSAASVRSERQRLTKLWNVIDGDPQKLWEAMQYLHPHSRVTYWGRIASFWDWRIKKQGMAGPNQYAEFRTENPRCFRGKYVQKPCEQTVEELRAGIERIPDEHADCRNKLLQLLEGGLRRTESYTLTPDGYVTGKGGKLRKVYVSEYGPMAGQSRYSTMLRLCKEYTGVTPHKLRSARLTRVADNGGNMNELMKFAGWSSPGPAASYVNVREERLKALAQDRVAAITRPIVAEAKSAGIVRGVLKWALAKSRERVE
jgi:integrase